MSGVAHVRGGVKFYRGAPRAARDYVEAGRNRADDYYLAEGTGLAARYTASGEGAVQRLEDLAGDGYEAWVAGADPDTGQVRGRVRSDAAGVRFAEVVVNGPKTWSLAAELHSDVAAAYERAQDAAAVQIIGWLSQHVTTRVGPRGNQVATPVERLEAVAVRHYTSRAGDPHRHLHLQINARVRTADGVWRGVDTVAVRQALGAVQGIGHAAVMCDPGFRQALASHGYSLDPESGEIRQLAALVPAVSRRTAQIARQVAGYEAQWRQAHPGGTPGPRLRRVWDARAWADQRPDKAPPGGVQPGRAVNARWTTELAGLGYTAPAGPVPVGAVPVGQIDRDDAAVEVLARVSAVRSAFNPADLHGETEQLIARAGVVVDPAVRTELVADIAARALDRTVRLLGDRVVPEHVRALSTPQVINIEEDITGRLAVRGALDGVDAAREVVVAAAGQVGASLDVAQEQAVAALAGDHALVVVSGAAGAGKTTTLAAARAAVEQAGHRLVVVAPTLKAARAARRETGAAASSAAKLAHAYGWRWDATGTWRRLTAGYPDPDTGTVYAGLGEDMQLHAGDVLVVDEAGMCGQDTARALLHLADEAGARIALVGDTRQLAAVGRGGVLDIAGRFTGRTVDLDVIHRFTRTEETAPGITADVPDTAYAEVSLQIRAGADPVAVFDQLHQGGHVQLHHTAEDLHQHLAGQAVRARKQGRRIAVAVDTREQAAQLNGAIRTGMIDAGLVDDTHTVATAAGQAIGVGDVVATRRNNRDLGVANRDQYTVTAIHADGAVTVTPAGEPRHGRAGVDDSRLLPAEYVTAYVELAYATTVHGVQGDTTDAGHLVLSEHTGAAATYVGMTRGRHANTAHLIAHSLDQARAQWVAAAGRGRADTGVAAARQEAQREAARYDGVAAPPPDRQQERLAAVLDALRAAWTEKAEAQDRLAQMAPRIEAAQAAAAADREFHERIAPLHTAARDTAAAAKVAAAAAQQARQQLVQRAGQIRQDLVTGWRRTLPDAAAAIAQVTAGPGRLGPVTSRRRDYHDAGRWLARWADGWRPVLPDLPASAGDGDPGGWARRLATHTSRAAAGRIDTAIADYATRTAAAELPGRVADIAAGEAAERAARDAATALRQARTTTRAAAAWRMYGAGYRDPADTLHRLEAKADRARRRLDDADTHIHALTADPAVTTLTDPAGWLAAAHHEWHHDHTQAAEAAAEAAQARAAARQAAQQADAAHRAAVYYQPPTPDRSRGPGIGL